VAGGCPFQAARTGRCARFADLRIPRLHRVKRGRSESVGGLGEALPGRLLVTFRPRRSRALVMVRRDSGVVKAVRPSLRCGRSTLTAPSSPAFVLRYREGPTVPRFWWWKDKCYDGTMTGSTFFSRSQAAAVLWSGQAMISSYFW